MIDRRGGIGQAGSNIFAFEKIEICKDLILACTARQHFQNVDDSHPRTRDNRSSVTDVGIDDNARFIGHAGKYAPGDR